ncbi:MAG: winged helix-turn-helix transcriptional regulator [Ignavibacteriaceae bacterium]|nr:winged helix-turn-helix transcriptional regulator [Ignavibacterium sp.]MCC6253514.1 winged helix-turn-helix transcriptional regulator [Ignavibacteriaceae bacterium]HRP91857.1 MarR family winged helix-turn-helix transcriptional regulator [Ignavibacteriaceae bacterium]
MKNSDFNLIHQNKSIESKIIASLERISQAFRVLLWNESKEHSLSPIQIQVLIFLLYHSEEKCKVTYLANEFNMTKATISEAIKTLEEKKLIKKTYEVNDTRSYIIKLTQGGRAIAKQTSLFTEQLQAPIDKLHPEDKENLLLNLIGIIQHLNNSGVITIQRMCLSCIYYKTSDNAEQHFCTLLNQELTPTELRVDCPDYQAK